MGLPMILLWKLLREELNIYFSKLSITANTTVSFNTIMQKPNKLLHIYVYHITVSFTMLLWTKLLVTIQLPHEVTTSYQG